MWIVDDEGDMFNTDHYSSIKLGDHGGDTWIKLHKTEKDYEIFQVFVQTDEQQEKRYYDLVEKLTGESIDG